MPHGPLTARVRTQAFFISLAKAQQPHMLIKQQCNCRLDAVIMLVAATGKNALLARLMAKVRSPALSCSHTSGLELNRAEYSNAIHYTDSSTRASCAQLERVPLVIRKRRRCHCACAPQHGMHSAIAPERSGARSRQAELDAVGRRSAYHR